jgi:serine/threonine protein kinase
MVGRTISHYRIVARLGAGGMGIVYRAEDVRLGRPVALKFLSEELENDEQAVRRLRAEARAASALNHASICTVYDIDEHQGHPFIVMELMKGSTVRERLATGPLKTFQLVDMGIDIADALHAAHTEGILHRDIKPGNIFLTERGHVKILDFGVAKLTPRFVASGATGDDLERTASGVALGTVAYMSPEQARGEDLDGRTDLFSLGVVLYECATGRHPFPGKTSAVILSAILNRAPVAPVALNPELPVRLQDVINNCLEKDRDLRYQSAADLRADLKRVRRDLESGRSRAVDVVTDYGPSRARQTPSDGVTSGTREPETPATRPNTDSPRLRMLLAVLAAIAITAAVMYSVGQLGRSPELPAATSVAQGSNDAIQNRLARAKASEEAKNHRAALEYATEVLALDSGNVEAASIRDEARAALARFDLAVSEARQRMAAGDLQAAARALAAARGIDATSQTVNDVAEQLAARVRQQESTAVASRGRPAPETANRLERGEPLPSSGSSASSGATPAPRAASPTLPPTAPSELAPSEPVIVAPRVNPLPPAQPSPEPPAPAQVATAPPAAAPANGTAAAAADRRAPERPPSSAAPAEDDEAAIRRVITTYAHAIESKDLPLFRSIKPNLSREEERRLRDGFRAVTSQRVTLTILSIERRADDAFVVVRRRDVIQAGARQQTVNSQQNITLVRRQSGWVISSIT